MPAGNAWPMIKACMEQQGPTPHHYVGRWIGPDRLEHDHPHEPDNIVAIGRCYEGPNLVLWTGTRHQVVLTLREE